MLLYRLKKNELNRPRHITFYDGVENVYIISVIFVDVIVVLGHVTSHFPYRF